MANGTINFDQSKASGAYIDAKVVWSATADHTANASDITVKLYIRKGDTTQTLTVPTAGTWTYSLTIGGTPWSGSVHKSVLESWVLVATKTLKDVGHKTDGSQTVTVSGSVTAPSGTSYGGHVTRGTGTIVLDTIPRASTIESLACSTAYLNGTITAVYTPKHADYYNRRVVYLNQGGTLTLIRDTQLGKKAAASTTSTVNLSAAELSKIYNKLPATTKGTLRVAFLTYLDASYSDQVGTTQHKEITLTIPTSIKPSATLKATQTAANKWIAGLGVHVAGYSQAVLRLTGTPGDGASVKTSTIQGDDWSRTGASVTVEFGAAGEFTFTGILADSRGRFDSDTVKVNVLPYSTPAVVSFTATRGTYGTKWVASDDGPDVRVTYKTTLGLADQGNTYDASFKLDGTARKPNTGQSTGLSSGETNTQIFKNINGDSGRTLEMTVTDKVGNTSTVAIVLPTIHVTIEFAQSGKGIAFGKTSEKNAFECAWPAYFGKAVYITDKITCPNEHSIRDFNINCNWADGFGHDMLVRTTDGLTTGLGWSGSGDDGKSYNTVLDVRPKQANFRGVITAPRGRFTATTDLSGTAQKNVALRLGDEDGQHIDMDSNEIQAKASPTTPGPLYLNLDGGDVYAKGFKIPEIQHGSARITPSAANTPTSMKITFPKEFSGTPTVVVSSSTSVPGTAVLGVGVNAITKTGCTLWVTRSNTTETVVSWIATY